MALCVYQLIKVEGSPVRLVVYLCVTEFVSECSQFPLCTLYSKSQITLCSSILLKISIAKTTSPVSLCDSLCSMPSLYITVNWVFKGTVSRDFLLLVFFMNQFPPSPRVLQQDRFEFFAKICRDIWKSRCTTSITDTGGKFFHELRQ